MTKLELLTMHTCQFCLKSFLFKLINSIGDDGWNYVLAHSEPTWRSINRFSAPMKSFWRTGFDEALLEIYLLSSLYIYYELSCVL